MTAARAPRRGHRAARSAVPAPAALVALGLLLAACSGGEDLLVEEAGGTARGGDAAAGTSTSDDADGVDADAGPRLDPSVLAGQATTVAGEAFDLGELAGQDLIIWFWAPW